jgi:NADPH-dependent glutamate synthase beta subunit-like oxidoreductase/ferredoxin
MIHLKINNQLVTVPTGTSILNAAKSIGVEIPTMCYLEGISNNPSCMICIVKDKRSGVLHPSCAMPVDTDMDIITNDDDVRNARKDALELLMSDHVGDCEAPCRTACPAFMDIPQMNRLIASGKHLEALMVVKEEIALPFILGYICSAPCEKVCRRKQVDSAVSICLLKRFSAYTDSKNQTAYLPEKNPSVNKRVAIIGSGPTGLACSFHLLKLGYSCVIFDVNSELGGTLLALSENELPKEVLKEEVELLKSYGAEFRVNTLVTPDIFNNEIRSSFDAIVFASGDFTKSSLIDFGFNASKTGLVVNPETFALNDSGVFACGSAVLPLKMAVKAVAQGKETAFAVNNYLGGKPVSNRYDKFNSKFGLLQTVEISEYLKESIPENQVVPKSMLVGFSEEEAVLEAKRCMHCDCRKPDTCKLRKYADEYKIDRKKYSLGERKTLKKHLQHDMVVYEPEKCIRCGLCIEITSKNKELTGLSYIGRGFDVRVDIPFNKELSQALTQTAKECADACPTGAIALKTPC